MELADLNQNFVGTKARSSSFSFVYSIRIGIVGYGKLGQYLVEQIINDGQKYRLDLAFIWNRTALSEETRSKILIRCPLVKFLEAVNQINEIDLVDLIVEVCHPEIVKQYAELFLDKADFLIGSPSALADQEFSQKLTTKLATCHHRMFVARGALWGANDIQMMARRNRLQTVEIRMGFHPRSLRLQDAKLRELNDELIKQDSLNNNNNDNNNASPPPPRSIVLYEGPARELCHIAPNNSNTVATAALLGVGFDHTIGKLISDTSLCDFHRIEIIVRGKPTIDDKQFQVELNRQSPTHSAHNVSSLHTFESFWHSILHCTGSFIRANNLEIQVC
ncbi:aspartate dehydrogenase domain-containing protein [Dermatophagoides farinae]|uniref:aspartate dehydrogenase domain-containing protein n=1 Tax=Dermatophagoides farinae TaxID=6954 RepID=UPI003F624A63